MRVEEPETPGSPDRRISWSSYLLAGAAFAVIFGALGPMKLFPILSGGNGFWIALCLGGAIGLAVNRLRPRYERTAGKWRSFYDFLLQQAPPPD